MENGKTRRYEWAEQKKRGLTNKERYATPTDRMEGARKRAPAHSVKMNETQDDGLG